MLNINNNLHKLSLKIENQCNSLFKGLDTIGLYNSKKILKSFHKYKISDLILNFYSSGYGYNDIARNSLDKMYANIFGGKYAIVRTSFISGTQTIITAISAMLLNTKKIFSITGSPYETLKYFFKDIKKSEIEYLEIELNKNNDFDYKKIISLIPKNDQCIIFIQRSRGYTLRNAITISQIKKICSLLKKINNSLIIIVDNCYCEFCEKLEPNNVGADISIGSLIKNPGAGLAVSGGYIICNNKKIYNKLADRISGPNIGLTGGPSLGLSKMLYQGLFIAPIIITQAIKTAIFTAKLMQEFNYNVIPLYDEKRSDIVQTIIFNDKNTLINFCQGIQEASPIDSFVNLEFDKMPGYNHKIIMSSGGFNQGASIELSVDAPLKKPYACYLQGSINYHMSKLAVLHALSKTKLIKKK